MQPLVLNEMVAVEGYASLKNYDCVNFNCN